MCGILSSAKVVYQMNPMERNLSAAPLEGVLYRAAQAKPAKVREKDRDPYDGLRPWSAITHGLGAVLALAGTVLLLGRASLLGCSGWHRISFLIFGLSMVVLYTNSTLYHCLNTSVKGRVRLRKLDHTSIYILIAGTYTPMCLVVLREQGAWGWTLLGIAWGVALLGLILCVAWITSPRWVTAGLYMAMGWMGAAAIVPMLQRLPVAGFAWLLAGGILYTVGGVLYAVKWPGRNNPRFGCHEIFHVFILAGTLCHFLLMYQVVAYL